MATVKDGKPKMVRHIGPASTWLETNKKNLAAVADADALVGHTRQPTKGAVTKANTHPFTIGDWAAAHNGMISNSSSLMEAALYAPRGETDSEEALCLVISYDWDPEVINKIVGSYALTGVKADGSEVVLVCDSAQSLHYVKFGNGIVWATSSTVLKSSLAAVGIQAEPIKLTKKIIRLPSWTEAEVDATSYSNYSGYGASYGYTSGASQPTFPIVKDEDGDKRCTCDHKKKNHHGENYGCFAKKNNVICPCSKFVLYTPADAGDCECKHENKRHTASWGCMTHGCKCEKGKLTTTLGTQASPEPAQQVTDTDKESSDIITEAEVAAMRAEGINMIDME